MFIHYKCDRCQFSRDMMYLPRVYLLPDECTVYITQRHGWCPTCNDISPFESLERDRGQVEMISEMISGHQRKLALALTPEEISQLPRRERFSPEWERQCLERIKRSEGEWQLWRNLRRAPEKCLRCGSTEIDMPESDWCDLKHAPCGGTIESPADIWSHNGPEKVPHVYSIDGELLKLGEKPVRRDDRIEYVPMELFWL
jgi:hypothetical protein